jgi:hypothetical protein
MNRQAATAVSFGKIGTKKTIWQIVPDCYKICGVRQFRKPWEFDEDNDD